ncbi:MAG: sugar isomerase [Armatimonadota bacterium]
MTERHDLNDGPTCPSRTCCPMTPTAALSRRELLAGAGAVALGAAALASSARTAGAESAPQRLAGTSQQTPLRVQPVLVYWVPTRMHATSWRPWGGVQTEEAAADERQRIQKEMDALKASADFPIEVLPLAVAQNAEQADRLGVRKPDVMLIYAAGGDGSVFRRLAAQARWSIMFVRHRSGPVYLWYEIAHPHFLRKAVDEWGEPGFTVHDVVVDSYGEVLWRLRALYGLRCTVGKRIVTVGGPSGWGAGGNMAPDISRRLWQMDIRDVPYPDLGNRIRRARENTDLVKRCRDEADRYLGQKGVSVRTEKQFVYNAFLLKEVFLQLLEEAQTDAITINACMGTIMPISETTACLPLSLLNDAGYMAFCESDFVVIPSGILLHHISGKPVFLNDPTYPHDGVVTMAHCTAPRRMDGRNPENAIILTHFESDYGAAPKVEMRKGQKMTVIDPDFACKRWLGFEAEVVGNPFMDICRSQVDVAIKGDCTKVLEEMRGFHWMACYGNYLRETGYALRKLGVEWLNVSA